MIAWQRQEWNRQRRGRVTQEEDAVAVHAAGGKAGVDDGFTVGDQTRALRSCPGGALALGLLTGCTDGRLDLGGGMSHSSASQFEPASLTDVVGVSRVAVLAEVLTPVRNLKVADRAPLQAGGPPISADIAYETAQVRIVSVLAQQAGAEAFGVTAGSVQDVGLATSRGTPPKNDGVTTPVYDHVPAGSTLPGVGAQVVLFLASPGAMPDGRTGLFVLAALRPTVASPDLLDPSGTPIIAGVSGPLEGRQAPAGWLAEVPATIGSRMDALATPAG